MHGPSIKKANGINCKARRLHSIPYPRVGVDSLCKDGADTPVSVYKSSYNYTSMDPPFALLEQTLKNPNGR